MRRNLIFVLFYQVSYVFTQFLQIPLFLMYWGPEKFGHWLLLQIPQLLTSRSDFGLGAAMSREVAMRLNSGRLAEGVGLFRTSITMIGLMQLAQLVVWCMIAQVAVGMIDSGGVSPRENTLTIIFMVLSGFMIAQLESLYAAFYATGTAWQGLIIRGIGQIVMFSFVVAAVISGRSMSTTAAAMFAGLLFPVILAVAVLFIGRSSLRPKFRRHFRELKPMIPPSLSMACLPLALITSQAAPRYIIGTFVGPVALVIFSAHRQICRVITLVYPIQLAFEPYMSAAAGRNDRREFLRHAADCQAAPLLLACFLGAAMTIATPWLFPLWLGREGMFAWAIFIPLMLSSVAEGSWRPAMSGLTAENKHISTGLTVLVFNLVGFAALWAVARFFVADTVMASWLVVTIETATYAMVLYKFTRRNELGLLQWLKTLGLHAKQLIQRALHWTRSRGTAMP